MQGMHLDVDEVVEVREEKAGSIERVRQKTYVLNDLLKAITAKKLRQPVSNEHMGRFVIRIGQSASGRLGLEYFLMQHR